MKNIIIAVDWSWDHFEKVFSNSLKSFGFDFKPFIFEKGSLNKISQLFPSYWDHLFSSKTNVQPLH